MKLGKDKTRQERLLVRILNRIEWIGNKLPHPITIFFWLTVITVVVSEICEKTGVSAVGEIMDTVHASGSLEDGINKIQEILEDNGIVEI
ncbi:MAG: AbgT family transporter, partial [Clostridium sp.]|uniref:AbgT family transporter n=1 Tax=Clostridium sp. TaxID=1506 RepID=UPI0025C119C8